MLCNVRLLVVVRTRRLCAAARIFRQKRSAGESCLCAPDVENTEKKGE
jgi:hypothetical protein